MGIGEVSEGLADDEDLLRHRFVVLEQVAAHDDALVIQRQHYLAAPAAGVALLHGEDSLVELDEDGKPTQGIVKPFPEQVLDVDHRTPLAAKPTNFVWNRCEGIIVAAV